MCIIIRNILPLYLALNPLQWRYTDVDDDNDHDRNIIIIINNNNNNNNNGANGTIWKSLRQYLSNIQGKDGIKEIKKTAILGTAHILREVLRKSTQHTVRVK
jgi:hypothetical protein